MMQRFGINTKPRLVAAEVEESAEHLEPARKHLHLIPESSILNKSLDVCFPDFSSEFFLVISIFF